MSYSFELKDFDAGGRIGQLRLGDKKLDTPNLFPVVNPFQNLVTPRRLWDEFGAQCLFTNAYIIYKNLARNPHILELGLHKHLDFPGIIATDSGGFQDYMYAKDIKITPEEIEPFQEQLGADCPVILDIPVQTTDSYEEAKRKIDITIQRAKRNVAHRSRSDASWFGPIHGSIYPELLKYSATEMSKLDFGIYAIGGVVKTFIDYRFDLDVSILLEVRKHLTPAKPLHMFGLGLPSFFSLAVACGADTFDSAAYILYAKDGRYFTLTGTKNLSDLDEFPCHCPICTKYTPKEVRGTTKSEKTRLLAEHNLHHSFSELRTIRQAMKEGSLWDLVEQRIQAHPKFIKALKKTRDYPEYFQNMLNFSKIKGQKYLSSQSYHRPVFDYYRQRMENISLNPEKANLILLPELDLPSINGAMLQEWLKEINSHCDMDSTEVIIVSNVMGAIPLDLAEIYPVGQHEGVGSIKDSLIERKSLLSHFQRVIARNFDHYKEIRILIPDSFLNEYGNIEVFDKEDHIISYLPKLVRDSFPSSNISIHNLISELANNA